MTVPSDFAACRAWLKSPGIEGGKSIDNGIPTNEGIEQIDFDAWCKLHGVLAPYPSVMTCTEATLTAIYKAQYWMPYCPFLAPGVNLVFFDTDVNQGGHIAVTFLQQALKIEADGKWGLQTAAAAKNINQPGGESAADVIKAMTALRIHRYKGTRHFDIDGKGWLSRAAKCQTLALQMAGVSP
jgi:lysozyme family protein